MRQRKPKKDQTLQSIGEHILLARRRLGATQADLANKANLSLRTVTRIEAGDGIVSLSRYQAAAHALRLRVFIAPESL